MECRWLKPDEKHLRRTIADALELLRAEANFSDEDHAEISVAPLPITTCAQSVALLFKTNLVTSIVMMPSTEQFQAFRPGESRHQTWDIRHLHKAVVHGAGAVRLTDGTLLKAVEIIVADLPWRLTPLDYLIMKHALAAMGLQEDSFRRSLREGVPEKYRETVPDLRWWDFAKLAQVRAPAFKIFQRYLERERSSFSVSRQKYFEALTKAGMCDSWPRGRRRAYAGG
jgi:hypothetical protein